MALTDIRLVPIGETGEPGEALQVPPIAAAVLPATARMYRSGGFEPPWIGYLAVSERLTVGTCAFKNAPVDGRVEIAYFTFPEFEGRGIATAMATRLVALARAGRAGIVLTAQTLPARNASNSILGKLGFEFAGPAVDAEAGEVWEWHPKSGGRMSFLSKLKGDGAALPPQPSFKSAALAWVGAFIAMSAVALLTDQLAVALVLGSFGASCVLVFGFPDVPFAQPRNVVVGHFLSSLIGLACLAAFGPYWWSVALAVGTAVAVMMLTRTVHPPAGSNPVIVYLAQPGWSFLLFPTLVGAIVIVAVALFYNNATRDSAYPKYW